MPWITPISRLAIGLILLTVSLILVSDILGLTPNQEQAELEARKAISEALAIQVSMDIPDGRLEAVSRTMLALQKRNADVVSIGLRNQAGRLLVVAGDHNRHWVAPGGDKSTTGHVQVPIHDQSGRWGTLEVSFEPEKSLVSGLMDGDSISAVILFVALSGFVAYSLFLKRALKELDPSAVVPDRVRTALNVLAEGLVIIGDDERVVLVNSAFEKKLGQPAKALIGRKLSALDWQNPDSAETPDPIGRLPWCVLLEGGVMPSGSQLKLRTELRQLLSFAVNVAPISGSEGAVRGAVVTFDDVTELEHKNVDLENALDRLKHSQREITRQNRELQVLATRDPLTGVLNRRSFFEALVTLLKEAAEGGSDLSCIMVDIDHFKSINDRFGHAVGDKVIKLVATILTETARAEDLTGRYGGEEFCVILPGANQQQAAEVAERMREAIHDGESVKFTSAVRISASFGISSCAGLQMHPGELVDRADRALYVAKKSGRNRVICWSREMSEDTEKTQQPAAEANLPQGASDQSGVEPVGTVRNNHHIEQLKTRIAELETFIREQNNQHTAGIDEATGLPSRVVLVDRIRQSMARCQRLGTRLAVLSVSIETVELVCNTLGHGAAEKMLRMAAARLKDILRSTDTVAARGTEDISFIVSRMGTREFVVVLTDMQEIESTTWVVQRMFSALKDPIELETNEFYLDASIGISLYPGDGEDPDALLSHSAAALREARSAPGRGVSMFYSKETNRRSREQIRMETELHRALERDELYLEYQPSVDLRSGRIVNLEALLRWRHSEWGLVSPMTFIPVAEHTGLINEIGPWVLSNASRQLKIWQQSGHGHLSVSVNFSAVQFRCADLANQVVRVVEAADVSTSSMIVEITESALIQNLETAVSIVDGLCKAGFRIALDDFGTGYSSLSYLKRFPIDVVKIDRSFLSDFPTHAHDTEIVSAIIAMAHGLGLRVIAEGVENETQLEVLQNLHCDEIQGYLFSKPLSREQITELLAKPTDIRRVVHAAGKFALGRQQAENEVVTGILNKPPSRLVH